MIWFILMVASMLHDAREDDRRRREEESNKGERHFYCKGPCG